MVKKNEEESPRTLDKEERQIDFRFSIIILQPCVCWCSVRVGEEVPDPSAPLDNTVLSDNCHFFILLYFVMSDPNYF